MFSLFWNIFFDYLFHFLLIILFILFHLQPSFHIYLKPAFNLVFYKLVYFHFISFYFILFICRIFNDLKNIDNIFILKQYFFFLVFWLITLFYLNRTHVYWKFGNSMKLFLKIIYLMLLRRNLNCSYLECKEWSEMKEHEFLYTKNKRGLMHIYCFFFTKRDHEFNDVIDKHWIFCIPLITYYAFIYYIFYLFLFILERIDW